MGQVYIRSQNKEALYVFNNFQGIEYRTIENYKYRNDNGQPEQTHSILLYDGGEELGRYESKERCIEVLDEIEEVCSSYLFTVGGAAIMCGGMDVQPMAADIPHIYQMPEK